MTLKKTPRKQTGLYAKPERNRFHQTKPRPGKVAESKAKPGGGALGAEQAGQASIKAPKDEAGRNCAALPRLARERQG